MPHDSSSGRASSRLTGAWLCALGLFAAACVSSSPPDPFALGRLSRTERSPLRLVALYVVPDVEELLAFAGREGYARLPGGAEDSRSLFEIAWEDAVDDALSSTFARVRRVDSPDSITAREAADVAVALEVVDVEIADGVGSRVTLRWTVTSLTGSVLWRDTVSGEAEEEDAFGVLNALRSAASAGRRAVLGDPGWRRYERAPESLPGCEG